MGYSRKSVSRWVGISLLAPALLLISLGRTGTVTALPQSAVFLPLVSNQGTCFAWHGQITLQTAVDQHACVEMQPGVWTTDRQIIMPADHILRGSARDTTILRAVAPWLGNGVTENEEGLVHDNGQTGVVFANFTADANGLATFGIGAHGTRTRVSQMRIINSRCDGVAIAGPGWQVLDNIIEQCCKF